MAISIIHFSIDENGKTIGGSLGDQTGKECCVRTWYNKSWDYYIEPIDNNLGNKAADLFEAVAKSNKAGYDQSNRLSFYKGLIVCNGNISKMVKCEADCSSGIASIYKFLGVNISESCTTRNIRSALSATGKFKVYSDVAHTRSDAYAKRGGIYLKEGSHVVMANGNGNKANIKFTTSSVSTTTTTSSTTYSYKDFVKEVQSAIGAKVDGIAGNETLSKTITISKTKNNRHAVVKSIQKYLNFLGYNCGMADGIFGTNTYNAIVKFQKANGCVADGIITSKQTTWKKLLKLV